MTSKKSITGTTTNDHVSTQYHRRGGAVAASTLFARAPARNRSRSRRTSAIPIRRCKFWTRALRNTGFTRRPSSRSRRHALGRRPAYFPKRLISCSPTSQQPHHEVRREDQSDQRLPRQRQLANGNARDVRDVSSPANIRSPAASPDEKDGKITVLADKFEGKRLNAPNDIVVKSDDSILVHRSPVRHQWRVGRQEGKARTGQHHVYRIAKDGKITAVLTDLVIPMAWRSRRTKRSSMS